MISNLKKISDLIRLISLQTGLTIQEEIQCVFESSHSYHCINYYALWDLALSYTCCFILRYCYAFFIILVALKNNIISWALVKHMGSNANAYISCDLIFYEVDHFYSGYSSIFVL